VAEDRYGLAPLRELREQHETARRGNLASAIGDAHVSATALEATRARTATARAALAAAARGREELRTAELLAAADRFIARRRRELAAARDEELRAELAHAQKTGEVETARAQLVRARADRELVDRHFARWRETRRKRAENQAD
jgi:hypothetical protein